MTFFALVLNRPIVLIASRSSSSPSSTICCGRLDVLEQRPGGDVDAGVGRLRRQHHRDEQVDRDWRIRARWSARGWPRPAGGRIRKSASRFTGLDDVAHRIEAGRLADEEARAGERTAGEDHAVVGAVRRISRSSSPGKITSWSPATEPPRSAAKPIVPGSRACGAGAVAAALGLSGVPRPCAAASPSSSAVPDGASTLFR